MMMQAQKITKNQNYNKYKKFTYPKCLNNLFIKNKTLSDKNWMPAFAGMTALEKMLIQRYLLKIVFFMHH